MERKDREALLVMAGTVVTITALAAGQGQIAFALVVCGIYYAVS